MSIFSLCYLFRNPFSSTTIGDENPIRTLGDYSKPRHEGYRNTVELPIGNNVVPLRSDTIRLVQNGYSFHGIRSEDPNQHLKISSEAWTRFKELLQKVPHHGIDLWLKVQSFYDHVNPVTRRTIDQSAGVILNKESKAKKEGSVEPSEAEYTDHEMSDGAEEIESKEEKEEETEREEDDHPEHFDTFPTMNGLRKFLIKNEEEFFVDAGDGVGIKPDGVIFDKKKLGSS
nr:MAK10-like protein [Tanacetum cinerariifolium]